MAEISIHSSHVELGGDSCVALHRTCQAVIAELGGKSAADLRPLARTGSHQAMYILSLCYLFGCCGVQASFAESRKWARLCEAQLAADGNAN